MKHLWGVLLIALSTPASPIASRPSDTPHFVSVTAGADHACALTVGGVGYCWGGNWHGQLGVGNRDGDAAAPCCYRVPTAIRTDVKFQSAVAGGISSCAVATEKRSAGDLHKMAGSVPVRLMRRTSP